jgi:uncharacterized membrane protein YeiH
MNIEVQPILDFIAVAGVISFAISGALTAMDRKFDIFGVFIIAFATSVGGGTFRDIMIPQRDVFWLIDPIYTYVIMAGTVLTLIFRKRLCHLKKTLSLFDTIGLALYTIIGVQIGMQYNLPSASIIAIGTITGSFGGVVRDILVNEVPLIFKKEIYATISILGGSVYYGLQMLGLEAAWTELVSIAIIIILRLVVVKYELSFPNIYQEK